MVEVQSNDAVAVGGVDLKALVKEAKSALRKYHNLSRKGALALWTAGKVLSQIKDEISSRKVGKWNRWCRDEGIALSTADQAVALFRFDETGEGYKGLTISEAKVKAGILKPMKGFSMNDPSSRQVAVEAKILTAEGTDLALSPSTTATEVTVGLQKDSDPKEEPPIHEPEFVHRLLVKINAVLDEAAKLTIPVGDQDAVDQEITTAIEKLNNLRSFKLKVVA